MRRAWHSWMAWAMESAPSASPAWMVMARLMICGVLEGFRWTLAGFPASAPARSKATTPWSLNSTASSARRKGHG